MPTEFVDGLDELELNLGRVENAVSDAGLLRALAAGGFVAEGRAKLIAREKKILDTGFLISTIQAQPPVKTARGAEVDIGVAAEYAVHHEFGAPKIKLDARPFMRPALLEGKPQIENAVRAALKREINSAIK